MPTYEYRCTACAKRFELFQGINAEPVRTCPECGGATERVISAGGGIVFRGSGFYATDYGRSSSDRRADKGDGGEAPAGESSSTDDATGNDEGDA